MGYSIQKRYRIKSTRLQNWDYRWNASYFITICTGGRECYFGDIKDKKVKLSEIGILADKFWSEIPDHFHFVKLDAYVIMPNHVHGIIIIDKSHDVEPLHATAPLPGNFNNDGKNKNEKMANISPKQGSLATIIRSYKSIVTKNAKYINSDFYWQSRYHDHIIRDQKSLENIRTYIKENPKKWGKDELNSEKNNNEKD